MHGARDTDLGARRNSFRLWENNKTGRKNRNSGVSELVNKLLSSLLATEDALDTFITSHLAINLGKKVFANSDQSP